MFAVAVQLSKFIRNSLDLLLLHISRLFCYEVNRVPLDLRLTYSRVRLQLLNCDIPFSSYSRDGYTRISLSVGRIQLGGNLRFLYSRTSLDSLSLYASI